MTSDGNDDLREPCNSDLAPVAAVSTEAEEMVTVTRLQLVVNLVAGGLGTGMLSLPWSMAGASVLPGLAMTVAVVLLNFWTIMILVDAAEARQVFDLGALLGQLPGRLLPGLLGAQAPSLGKLMQAFTNIMVWVTMMGSLVSYLIVIHDSAKPFLADTSLTHSRGPLVSAGALLVLPLCFLDQRYLSFTSSAALLVNVYLISLLMGLFGQRLADHELPQETCLVGFGTGSVAMMATLAQCIIIQMCILPMYHKLEDRSPARFQGALLTAFGILISVFGLFASLGYLTFGSAVQSNVLNSLPHNVAAWVARLGMVAVVAAIYPIMVLPMVAPVENIKLESLVHVRKALVRAVTLAIVITSWIGALYIESLGFVNVIDGSICVGIFTALAPGLVGLFVLAEGQSSSNQFKRRGVAILFLLVFGFTTATLGLVYWDNYTEELKSKCVRGSFTDS